MAVNLDCEVGQGPWMWAFPWLSLGPLEFTCNSGGPTGLFIQSLSNLWTPRVNSLTDDLIYVFKFKGHLDGIVSEVLCTRIFSIVFIHEWSIYLCRCLSLLHFFLKNRKLCLSLESSECFRHPIHSFVSYIDLRDSWKSELEKCEFLVRCVRIFLTPYFPYQSWKSGRIIGVAFLWHCWNACYV